MEDRIDLPDTFQFEIPDGMMTRTIADEANRLPVEKVFKLLQSLRTWERFDKGFRHTSEDVQVEVAKGRRHAPPYLEARSKGVVVAMFRDNDADGPVGVAFNQLDDAFRSADNARENEVEAERKRDAEAAEMRVDQAASDLLKKFKL